MALAAAFMLVSTPVRAALVSFEVQGVHVDFDFSPIELTFSTPVTLADGTLMQTVTGSNAMPRSFTFKVTQPNERGPSWAAYGWYDTDGLTVARFRQRDGGSRLHVSMLSADVGMYYSDVSTLSMDYICALCGDLYDAPLDAALLSHSTPVRGEVVTEWTVPASAHNSTGGHGVVRAVFPAVVPEASAWAMGIAGLLVLAWRFGMRHRRAGLLTTGPCMSLRRGDRSPNQALSGAPWTGTAPGVAASGS